MSIRTAARSLRSAARENPGGAPLLPAACAALAMALCLLGLTARSIWIDEAVALRIAQTPGAGVLMSDGGNMAAYYLLLRGWLQLGDELWLVRLPSVLFTAGAVGLLYLLARRLFESRRIAVAAAVLLAVNSSVVRYGQEARSYAMALFLTVAGWLLLDLALERRRLALFVLWGLVNALAVATHLFSVLLVAAQVASLALLPRRALSWKEALAGLGVTAAGASPLLRAAANRGGVQIDWIPPISGASFRQVLLFLGGNNFEPSSEPFPATMVIVVLVVCLIGWSAGMWFAVESVLSHGRSRQSWRQGVALAWLIVPLAGAALASATVQPLMVPRFFLGLIPAGCLLLAVALSRIPQRPALIAAVAGLTVLGLSGVVRAHGYGDWGWREAALHLAARAGEGDRVVVLPARQRLALDYHLERLPDRRRLRIVSPQVRSWRPPDDTLYGVSEAFLAPSPPEAAAEAAAVYERFWVVTSDYTRFDAAGRIEEAWDEAGEFFDTLGPGYVVGSARTFPRLGVLSVQPAGTGP
ncbi:MAG TPA: glycosyltransferase family 39 protein [Actinomycetota bacterium]|nr:glycosyltransferase family 39 protein [Actinomycetota bacterium]